MLKAIRATIGAAIGVAICYLFGAVIAWEYNPEHWPLFLRLWCVLWAVFWAPLMAIIVDVEFG